MAKVLQQQQSVVSGSAEEKQYLDRLTRDILDMNVDFVDFVSKSKASKEYVAQRTDSINNDYNQRLMMMITMPLRRGCNKESILQSIGVAAGAMLFNKEFRKSCSATVQNLMYPYVSAIADRSKPGGFWDTQRRKLSMAQNGRLPLTPESAAVMHLGFCKNAYNLMREPGADRDKILKDYKSAVTTLRSMAKDDGISPDVLNQSIRTIAGQLIERDPKLSICFEELSFRGVKRGAGKVENMTETWKGEYLDASGEAFAGAFNPRVPRTREEYGAVFAKFFSEQFDSCKTPEALADKMRTKEHKQLRDGYMDLMMQDGMAIEQVHEYVTEYMRQGVDAWCNKNGIRTKDGSKRSQPRKEGPGKQPNRQPNEKSGPRPGQDKGHRKESPRASNGHKPEPPEDNVRAIRAAGAKLKKSMQDILSGCDSADDIFGKLTSKDAAEAWNAYKSETDGVPWSKDVPEERRKSSSDTYRGNWANVNIRKVMQYQLKGTYFDTWDGNVGLAAVAKVDVGNAKLGSKTYEEPDQAFFDKLNKATEHLAIVPELRQSVIMHACRNNMVAFHDNLVKECSTSKEFMAADPDGSKREREMRKYEKYFESIGIPDEMRGKAVAMTFDRARDESTVGWCKAKHVAFHFDKRFDGEYSVAFGRRQLSPADDSLDEAFADKVQDMAKEHDEAELGV